MKIEAKVGLFIVVALGALFIMSMQIGKYKNFAKEGYEIYAYIDDVSGLENKSKVKVNGLEAGYLQEMTLDTNKIKLTLFIFNNIKIPIDSTMQLAQESMLGGKQVVITLGKSNQIINTHEYLVSNGNLADFSTTSNSVNEAALSVKEFMNNLNSVLDDQTKKNLKDSIDNIAKTTDELRKVINSDKLNNILDNVDILLSDISNASKKFGNMSSGFEKVSDTLNNKLPNLMDEIKALAKEFQTTGKNLNKKLPTIMEKFESVEDSVYSLIEENKKDVNEAIKAAKGFFSTGEGAIKKVDTYLDSISKTKLEVALKTAYMMNDGYGRGSFGLSFITSPTRYYMIEAGIANDYSQKKPDGKFFGEDPYDESHFLVSAQMGKKYDNWLVRGGIIENSGGIGIDYFMFQNDLVATLEAYDFNAQNDLRADYAHVNLGLRYLIGNYVEAYFGLNDLLNDDSRNVYLGIGVRFIDDDLKSILGSVSTLSSMGN